MGGINGRSCLLAGVAAVALAASEPALAQTAPASGAPATGAVTGPSAGDTIASQEIGSVVVTARHRLENLQSVPIAISVVEGSQAAAKNLNDIQDISEQVPAIDFRTSASNKDQTIFVRGVGTISTSPGVEPSVSTVIDGVVIARAGAATIDLLDLDHVEVLEGPQGTLFGKNASAGVINIVTRNPTNHLGGYFDGSYFEGNEYHLNAAVYGPITDTLKGLISGFDSHYDGNVENLYLHEKVNGYQNAGFRGKLVYTPTSTLTLTGGVDFTRSYENIPTGVFTTTNRIAYPTDINTNYPAFGALLASEGVTPSSDNRTISSDDKSRAIDYNEGVNLQADWDIGGGYTITSITAYRNWRNTQFQDYDQTSQASKTYPQIGDIGHLHFDQTSEELRIASPKGHLVDYVAGLYYLDASDNETYERDVNQPGGSGVNNGVGHYGSTDINYAVFGEANVNFLPNFRAIIGGRAVGDDLSFYNHRVATVPPAGTSVTGVAASFSAAGSETKDGFSGRFGLQYDLTPLITAYATYSRGYKGPAYNVYFNQNATATAPLAPETSNDYEAGVKAQFFQRRLQADLSIFREDFSNYQANSSILVNGAIVTNLVNAGSVRTQGVEANLTARPIRGLTLDLNGIYDDAQVVNFPCPAGSPITCDINGGRLPFAPKWKTHVQGDYQTPLTSMIDIDFETDYNWQSDTQYQLTETPQTIQPAYGIWNGSVALIWDRWGLTTRFLVKNIADQHYSSYLSTGTEGATGIVRWVPRDDSRYVGVDVRKTF